MCVRQKARLSKQSNLKACLRNRLTYLLTYLRHTTIFWLSAQLGRSCNWTLKRSKSPSKVSAGPQMTAGVEVNYNISLHEFVFKCLHTGTADKVSWQLVICPIAIAYSMGQIIKSVCVCQSVRLRALSRSHFLIDFHQNWHRRKYPQKEERVR